MREDRNRTIREDRDQPEDLEGLNEAIEGFRNSVHAAAKKPAVFWQRQHAAIMSRIQESMPVRNSHARLVWVPAAVIVLLCVLFLVKTDQPPKPDLAAGSDQILLVEIERALNQECPEALLPAPSVEKTVTRK